MREFYRFICLLGRPVNIMQGTFGSLVGVLLALVVSYYDSANYDYLLYTLIVLYTLGTICVIMYDPKTDSDDIVIDEVLGQMLSIYLTFKLYNHYVQCYINTQWFLAFIALNFVLFRMFDILKPCLIWAIDKKMHNPFGIMLDDVLAAIYASILSVLILSYFLYC